MLVKLLKTLGPAEEAGMAAFIDVAGAAATVTVERIVVGMQVLIVMTETDGAADVAGSAAFIEVGEAGGATALLDGVVGIATGEELGVETIEGAAAVDEDRTEDGVTKVTVKVAVDVDIEEGTDTGATVGLATA